MRIKVLGCYGGQLLGFHLTSFLVNDSILLDAGSPTEALDLEDQFAIRHIFISHTHLDHIKDIAFLADNRSLKRLGGANGNRQIVVHSLPENIEVMRKDFFNNRVWPDFTRIPSVSDPILVFEPIEAEQTVEVDGVKVTAIAVNHPVPCTGFLIDQDDKQFIYTADTGSTDRIWEVANAQPNLKGIVVDCSFPNAYEKLAEISGHLTPNGMAAELAKFKQLGKVPVYLYHMKPETLNVLTSEVGSLFLPHLRMLTQVDELLL
ncbi:MAG: MBL fold metallo-hydrolase [Zetaproteobacteria bacterium CG12_big_fil_rev_8_21_14_0_65_55_1124]|nr:MAG: MBL fold metallo-hydrolase [Zetaproteobacteria bacterium CG1_02_55_237]PIS20255.1 MAG: MBL fold metallo-hydrolase [Zetaproteobacteria bacterium CG08_land_8_20_14_0_20_55_17]PIW43132.1 MAG: MBL fold metallo-hydrolase [Zetaproteobacteria bacterium CG12_big_fil_rev_8_21_14_0_65_55_1124]PIY52096.1 MAG: MBL fold metallo-hydrolase [Zetaproteobacteria bacterium CG_4_10_14_0_8_um_filter_55_43]PIZ38108.1 MAG: MBL fold metallo-hydrolase [Zetaproteobacteria bacterium CG_4_10_14_0_2_um_filter_55_20